MSKDKVTNTGSTFSALKSQASAALAELRGKRDAIIDVMKTGKADLKSLSGDIKALEKITGDKTPSKPRKKKAPIDAAPPDQSADVSNGATA